MSFFNPNFRLLFWASYSLKKGKGHKGGFDMRFLKYYSLLSVMDGGNSYDIDKVWFVIGATSSFSILA